MTTAGARDEAFEGAHALPRTRRPTSPALVLGLAALSGAGAVESDASPTGSTLGDLIWLFVFGSSLSLAMSDARRWAWFPAASLSLAVASGWIATIGGLAALGLTVVFGFNEARRRRWMGALVGLLAAQALVRGRTYGFTGLPTVVAVAACVPAYWSAFKNTSNRARRVVKSAAVVTAVVISLLTIFTVVSAFRARASVLRAIDFGEQAIDAAEDGDHELATVLLVASRNELRSIEDDFAQLWLAPGRYVPILGQHSTALRTMADAGADVANDGAVVMSVLDPVALLPGEGRVDIDAVEELVPRMNRLFDTLERSAARIDQLDLTWIAGVASSRIETLREELDRFDQPITDARNVTSIIPDMLGADGDRRYLVMFMTPAELRSGGGFAGNWAELVVEDGQLSVGAAGRGNDLNDALPDGEVVLPSPELEQRYPGWRLTSFFQNLPAVADFRDVGEAAGAFYEQATGRSVDGVIGIDTRGMGSLVDISGPVEVDGRTLDAAGLEAFVLTGQYVDYERDQERRLQVLDDLTRRVFDRLTSSDLPSPFRLAEIAGPLVDGSHLQFVSFDREVAFALRQLDADGAFPERGPFDLLSVRTQNLGENKIDTYLDRDITYQLLYDPATGQAQASLSVLLTNGAPAEGLPDAIIGNNDQGFPFGTNATRLVIRSPLGFRNVAVGDEGAGVQIDQEFGWQRYRIDVHVPPGESRLVRFDLSGVVDVSAGYRLLIDSQPLTIPDDVTLDLRQVGVGEVPAIVGWDADSATSLSVQSDQWVSIPQAE